MRCRSIRSEHRLFRQQARGVTKILQERAHLCAVKRNGNRERLATLRSGRANCCVRQLVDWERDCLMRELPDRKNRAEDDQSVDQYLQHVALFLFRTNQQSVGRFKVLHKVWIDCCQLLMQRACQDLYCQSKSLAMSRLRFTGIKTTTCQCSGYGKQRFRFWDGKPRDIVDFHRGTFMCLARLHCS